MPLLASFSKRQFTDYRHEETGNDDGAPFIAQTDPGSSLTAFV